MRFAIPALCARTTRCEPNTFFRSGSKGCIREEDDVVAKRIREAPALVYASAAHDARLCERLREAGWSVELIGSAHELERTLRHTPSPNVGLLEPGDDHAGVIDSIAAFCV